MIKRFWVITSDHEIYFFNTYNKANIFTLENILPQKVKALILERIDKNQFVIYGQNKIKNYGYFENMIQKEIIKN